MTLSCPIANEPAPALSAGFEGKDVRRTAVLVVDDEPLLRMMAVDLVEGAGFECLEAANADEAITILEARADIRVVFTDVHMPGSMDGITLANYVRRRWPPVELIVTSGVHKLTEFDLPPRGLFFPKPYQREQIVSALQGFGAR